MILDSEAASERLGAELARAIVSLHAYPSHGMHLHLSGPLGAGKTTTVRGLLRALGETGPVKSPTFTLVEPYEGVAPRVYHFDLYRLADPEELELIGARDYFRAGVVCCFEWPERAGHWLPPASLALGLEHHARGREATLVAGDDSGRQLLARLEGHDS